MNMIIYIHDKLLIWLQTWSPHKFIKGNKFNGLSTAELKMPESMLPRHWNLLSFQQSCQGNTGSSLKSCLGPERCWHVQQNIPVRHPLERTKGNILSKRESPGHVVRALMKVHGVFMPFSQQGTPIFNISCHVSRTYKKSGFSTLY